MNQKSKNTQTLFKKIPHVAGALLFTLATLFGVYFFEGVVASPNSVPEALAWQCEYARVSPSEITLGESSTLSWKFSDDTDIYVTVDALPGQSWQGVSGSIDVSPKVTTTYWVIAHKTGTDTAYDCSATVTVKPPVESCDKVGVTLSDNSFTFTGPPALVSYKVDYCDNTNSGWVDGPWSDKETITLGKRIKAVFVEAGTCKKEAHTTCDTLVVPACPFSPSDKVTVINFNGGKTKEAASLLLSNADSEFELTASANLVPGLYTIKTYSWDGYSGREEMTQPREQWNVEIRNTAKSVLGKVGPTTDLLDRVYQNSQNNTFTNAITLSETGKTVAVVHSAYRDNSSPNSVVPVCVALELQTPDNNKPACTMSISSSKVRKGDNVTLTWTSTNASKATIDQGLGSVNLDGSKNISITDKKVFTGTFTDNKNNVVTCSATVSIQGGGGSCLNCDDDDKKRKDDDDPKPSIVLAKTITKVGSYVTLDQVPYTGFEAGPALTLFFWMIVLALSVGIAYVATLFRPLERLRYALGNYSASTYRNNENVDYAENNTHVVTQVADMVATEPLVLSADAYVRVDGVSNIEEAAHKENILLSPEALRYIQATLKTVGISEDVYLVRLFEKAKAQFSREDGWILLSKERTEALSSEYGDDIYARQAVEQETKLAPVSMQHNEAASEKPFRVEQKMISRNDAPLAQPQASNVQSTNPMPQKRDIESSVQELVATFIEYIILVEKKKTFDLLRTITAKGVDVGTFMTIVVRQLDDVYKHRLEGNHNPNKELAKKTGVWSNHDFEVVIGMLVECVDYSYSNNKIGTKIALTKAFDHFAETHNK